MKAHLADIAKSHNQELLYSIGEECVSLPTGNIRDDLSFDQCEADTILLSIYTSLRLSGNTDPVVIDAEATYIYI